MSIIKCPCCNNGCDVCGQKGRCNNLHLNLHKQWFDMIRSGQKKEEYRDNTLYWRKKLLTGLAPIKYDYITFSNGYAKNRAQYLVKVEGMTFAEGKTEWGAKKYQKYFVIRLGAIIEFDPKERKTGEQKSLFDN